MATFRFYYSLIVESAAAIFRGGTGVSPVMETTITGVPVGQPQRLAVAAGATVTLYQWQTGDAGFETFFAHLVGGGYGVVSALIAKPTSATDNSPQATATRAWRWRHQDLGGIAPCIISSDDAYMNDDAASEANDFANTTAAGFSVSNDALVAGATPTLWTVANVQGRVYKIVLHNPGATSITVEYGKVK